MKMSTGKYVTLATYASMGRYIRKSTEWIDECKRRSVNARVVEVVSMKTGRRLLRLEAESGIGLATARECLKEC